MTEFSPEKRPTAKAILAMIENPDLQSLYKNINDAIESYTDQYKENLNRFFYFRRETDIERRQYDIERIKKILQDGWMEELNEKDIAKKINDYLENTLPTGMFSRSMLRRKIEVITKPIQSNPLAIELKKN